MPTTNTFEKIWQRITVTSDGCWLWAHIEATGYGRVRWQGKRTGIHRFMYERAHGPIPDGYQIDHLCRVTACCNPQHLDAVPAIENVRSSMAPSAVAARTNYCQRGHSLADAYVAPNNGKRQCRVCCRLRKKGQLEYQFVA